MAAGNSPLTQKSQTPVAPYFIPMAYAMILLRANAGLPCVFYADLFGSCGTVLPKLVLTRRLYAYGTQFDFFDDRDCVGFTRLGHPSHCQGAGLAVVLNNARQYAIKRMFVGERHAGETWTDILRGTWGEVVIVENGWGQFPVGPRSVAVWANRIADSRERVDSLEL